ncbi:unnamed protein product [Withania somnifera]
MGALTSNRKRGNNLISSNSKTPLSNMSNLDSHIPQKLKFSVLNPSPLPSKSSTVHRFFKYPDVINPIRREVHGPCRKSRFGYKGNLENSGPEMGVFLSRKCEEANRSDFDSLRSFKNDVEVIDIDDDGKQVNGSCRKSRFGYKDNLENSAPEMGSYLSKKYEEAKRSDFDSLRSLKNDIDDDGKEGGLEGSSIEELEAWSSEKGDLLGKNSVEVDEDVRIFDACDCKSIEEKLMEVDGDVEILDSYDGRDASVVMGLDDGNLKEESVGKMIESLDMNPTTDSYFYVPLYKKLLGSVEKISHKLKSIHFQIGFNEKCHETNRLLRPQEKGEHVKKDVIEEPFVPLTEEEQDEVSRALSKSNRRRVLLTHKSSNIDITGAILQCLRPGQWLNDEVINVYLELLKEREKRVPQKFLKCHFFSTFFYKKLISGKEGYNYQSVRRWTSQRKLGYCLLECDKIFVPIHKEIHWCLAVINKKDKKFQYLDSLRGQDSNVLKVLARYFVDEVKDKSGKHIDVSSWNQEFVEDLPVQENGYDCGVFMIKNADFYSRDIGLCFNQGHMSYFRLRTAKELLRLKAD